MDLQHFLHGVERRVGAGGDTQAVVDAALSALAEHLTDGEARKLRSQLPERLQAPLLRGGVEPFDWDEFVRRVAERAGIDHGHAATTGAAVIDGLRDAVDPSTFTRFLDQLPASFPTAGDPVAAVVRGRAHARWQPGAQPGEWVVESEQGHRGVVRRVAGEYEAQAWREEPGPMHGPQVFDDADIAVEYIEANLGVRS